MIGGGSRGYLVFGNAAFSELYSNKKIEIYDGTATIIRLYGWSGNSDDDEIIISRIGDVNGDGREDWAIGYPTANNQTGRVVVMFGKPKTENFPASLNIFSVSENYGFVISGIKAKIRFLKKKT